MLASELLSLSGTGAIVVALIVIGLLSRRMSEATGSAPYYLGFFLGAALVGASVTLRLLNALFTLGYDRATGWVLVQHGLPALGVTLGVVMAWRYWSWLLAERD